MKKKVESLILHFILYVCLGVCLSVSILPSLSYNNQQHTVADGDEWEWIFCVLMGILFYFIC